MRSWGIKAAGYEGADGDVVLAYSLQRRVRICVCVLRSAFSPPELGREDAGFQGESGDSVLVHDHKILST